MLTAERLQAKKEAKASRRVEVRRIRTAHPETGAYRKLMAADAVQRGRAMDVAKAVYAEPQQERKGWALAAGKVARLFGWRP